MATLVTYARVQRRQQQPGGDAVTPRLTIQFLVVITYKPQMAGVSSRRKEAARPIERLNISGGISWITSLTLGSQETSGHISTSPAFRASGEPRTDRHVVAHVSHKSLGPDVRL